MRDNKYRYSIKSQERNAILSLEKDLLFIKILSHLNGRKYVQSPGKDFVTRGFKNCFRAEKSLPDKKVFDELKQDYGLARDITQSWVDVMTTLNTETRVYLENLESRRRYR